MRQERERRYISQYCKENLPSGAWQLNVELGAIPADYIQRYGTTKAAALFRPTRPRVDAVCWTPETYWIIEAKIRSIKNGIGDLQYYLSAAKQAPDLPFYEGQPLRARLIVPWMLDWLKPSADAAGVEVVVLTYPWIEDYIHEVQHYFTAEYRAARAEKMAQRKILGVE